MNRYVAFLRGMNLGGRRITNDALRSHFEKLGCEDVATFRASGNVVFAKAGRPAELTTKLEEGLGQALGYEVPIFLRSAKQLLAIVGQEPFDAKQLAASKGKPQIAFLVKKPSSAAAKRALSLAGNADLLLLDRLELYWLPEGGLSESDLDHKALAEALGPMTIRTKGTVDQIAEKYFSE